MTRAEFLETRHVRTGKYVIENSHAPRALTVCGAEATGDDYSWNPARDALHDGCANAMCLSCRSELEARYGWRNLSGLSNKKGSSTPKQRQLYRQLVREAEQNGCYSNDLTLLRDVPRLSRRAAAAHLDELIAQKNNGWKRRAVRAWEFDDTALNDFVASLPKGNGTRAKWAIANSDIKTLAQLKTTDPYVVFSTKNAGVGAIKALLDAGVWPGVTLASATRKRTPKLEASLEAAAKIDQEFLLALEADKTSPATRGFQKLLQLGTVQNEGTPTKVSKRQAAAIVKTLLRALSTILDTHQKATLTKILQDASAVRPERTRKS